MLNVVILYQKSMPKSFLKYIWYVTKSLKALLRARPTIRIYVLTPYEVHNLLPKLDGSKVVHVPYLGRGSYPPIRILQISKINKAKMIATLHGFDTCALRY